MSSTTPLYILPNEILLAIFSLFPTLDLLPLTTLSTRLSSLIIRLVRTRLLLAASLPAHKLLLECYPPAQKLTAPPLYCTYLGTPGLDDEDSLHGAFDKNDQGERGLRQRYQSGQRCDQAQELERLGRLQSHYRPHHRPRSPAAPPPKHPAGDIPGSRTHPSSSTSSSQARGEGALVRQFISLDSHELFTQLCCKASLVKLGPRSRWFQCLIDIEDGVVRVFRDWLARVADTQKDDQLSGASGSEQEEDLLWMGHNKNVGFRLHVIEKRIRRAEHQPVLTLAGEDSPVSYELEYEELRIRTRQLLLALERSFVQQSYSSRAVVFGSFG